MWPKNTGERDLGPLYVSHVPAGRFVLEEIKRIVGPGASTLSVHKNLCTLESLSVRSGVSLKGFWRLWPKNTGERGLGSLYVLHVLGL